MDIGKNLRRYRKDRGMTQVELAARSGVSQVTISEIETGAKPGKQPLHVTIAKLAAALGLSVPQLVTGEEKQTMSFAIGDLEEAALELMRTLEPEQQELWLSIGRTIGGGKSGALESTQDENTRPLPN